MRPAPHRSKRLADQPSANAVMAMLRGNEQLSGVAGHAIAESMGKTDALSVDVKGYDRRRSRSQQRTKRSIRVLDRWLSRVTANRY
jgi:hypothetical protein